MSLTGNAAAKKILRGKITKLDVIYADTYEIAVRNGYKGTVEEWLSSLHGKDGTSVTHEWDGTVLKVKSASGTSEADLKGEKGDPGTSITILGTYDTEAELKAAHPTGNVGDGYIIDGDLYVWLENASAWENVGTVKGPQGEPGKDGQDGTDGKDYVLTDADREEIAGMAAESLGAEEKVLLWENAATSAAAQTISLGDVSAYSEYIVELQTADGRPFSARGIIGNTTYSGSYMYTNSSTSGTNLSLYMEIRAFKITTDGTFNIYNTTRWLLGYNSGAMKITTSTGAEHAVPMRVYGVKGA